MTIFEIFKNNIFIPNYQRAYSWKTNDNNTGQINQFLNDLHEYIRIKKNSKSNNIPPYFFGHFLFEVDDDNKKRGLIDGQQRLTTIYIFLNAVFNIKKETEIDLTDLEKKIKDIFSRFEFKTVEYDQIFFEDIVLNNYIPSFKTSSQKKIIEAYSYFVKKLKEYSPDIINALSESVINAECTTHDIRSKYQSIQMFIFQNNRGIKVTKIDLIKSMFMQYVWLHCEQNANSVLDDLTKRFANIFESISVTDDRVDENDVLNYTFSIYDNKLSYSDSFENITKKLSSGDNCIEFITKFTQRLSNCFDFVAQIVSDSKEEFELDFMLTNKRKLSICLPFMIKAYLHNLSKEDKLILAKLLNCLVIRHAVIGTRAELSYRLGESFQNFQDHDSLNALISLIKQMKKGELSSWWNYWTDKEFENQLKGYWSSGYHHLAKMLLWRYENYLRSFNQKKGYYSPLLWNEIQNPQLEHISPQTQKDEKLRSGYDRYDDVFLEQYLCSLGNFLLISQTHNVVIGNEDFKKKRESYKKTGLFHLQEIIDKTDELQPKWTRKMIKDRTEYLIRSLIKEQEF